MRLGVGALLLVLTCAFTACGNDEPERDVQLDTESTSAPSAEASRSDSTEKAKDDKPVDGKLLRGRNPAGTGDESAVAEVWFAYWEELVRSYSEPSLDRDRLAELAKDDAFSDPAAYVARMQAQRTHNTGGMIAGIRQLKVSGNKAEVQGCFRTTLIEVNEKGAPVEPPEVFLQTVEELEKEGPDWRVSEITVVAEQKACEFR